MSDHRQEGSAPVVALPTRSALLAEIERDVRAQRRSGAITAEFELELERAWEEVSPPGASGGGFDSVADQAARHAIVDYDAPIIGSKLLRLVKKTVKQLTAWYMIFVGRQLVAFAGTSLRAMRILARRVDALEHNSPATDPRVARAEVPVQFDTPVGPWIETVVNALSDVAGGGRVVHLDCGDGALVVALSESAIDAYGVDPRTDAGAVADAHSVEVRRDHALAHLRLLSPGQLRSVVLSGCVDRSALGDQLELVTAAINATHAEGVVMVIGRNPRSWAMDISPLASDLGVGRPLHQETWCHLFTQAGMTNTQVVLLPAKLPAIVASSADPAVAFLAQHVCVPESFCVIARRS